MASTPKAKDGMAIITIDAKNIPEVMAQIARLEARIAELQAVCQTAEAYIDAHTNGGVEGYAAGKIPTITLLEKLRAALSRTEGHSNGN
jgi:hypothetical protein